MENSSAIISNTTMMGMSAAVIYGLLQSTGGIERVMDIFWKRVCGFFFVSVHIIRKSRNSCKHSFAVFRELNDKLKDQRSRQVRDGNNSTFYDLRNGSYTVYDVNQYYINVILTDEEICLWRWGSNFDIIDSFVSDVNLKYNKASNSIIFYNHSIGENKNYQWGYPTHKEFSHRTVTSCMENMINSVDKFITSVTNDFSTTSDEYSNNRRGYAIVGPPGTGKSTIVSEIAERYKYSIYSINMNSLYMTDLSLVNLLCEVPDYSLVVFDEFQSQYTAMKQNSEVHITQSGILSALDGVQKLGKGVIVIIISNSLDELEPDFKEALMRVGRIDEEYVFDVPITSIDSKTTEKIIKN